MLNRKWIETSNFVVIKLSLISTSLSLPLSKKAGPCISSEINGAFNMPN
jgi:hypothetical protein